MSSTILIRVQLLDDTDLTYNIQVNNTGNVVFEAVAKDLNLVEADYFGLLFQDKAGNQAFLNPLKKIKQQLSHAENCTLKFAVKFFPPDPGQLHEEYTRYLFALQVKRDIASGNLVCSGDTFAIMIAYIVQSEFGDWSNAECEDLSYLKELKILPQNYSDDEFLAKTCEEHKNLVGLSPSQADRKLLDVARKLDLYGIHMHSAKDRENTSIQLAVTHEGVVVLRGNAKINTFNWSRVRKLSFKKKRFLVKLKPENSTEGIHGNVGNVIVFLMTSRDACKIFWRHCIEYHAFFRLESRPEPRPQPRFFKRGSTFRYSGRTQRQLQDRVRNSDLKRTDFVRRSHRKYASMRSSRPTPIPTSTQPMYKQSTKIVSKDDTALSNGGRGTNLPLTSVQDKPEVTSNRADEAWQVESKNLHSNAVVSQTRIEPRESGNNQTSHMIMRLNADHSNPRPFAPSCSHVISKQGIAHANDNDKARFRNVNMSAQNLRYLDSVNDCVSTRSRNSGSYTSNTLPHLRKNKFTPPVPPKNLNSDQRRSQLVTNRDSSHLDEFPAVWRYSNGSFRLSFGAHPSRNHSVSLSISEISLPALVPGESGNHYALLEKKMIDAGFYSVPKKPPIVPEPEVENAKTPPSNRFSSTKDNCSSSNSSRMSSLSFSSIKDLFAPIEMKFDDHYTAPPLYSNTTTLSVYYAESNEHLPQPDVRKQSSSNHQFLALSMEELDCLRRSGYELDHCAVLCSSDNDEVIEM